jgi:hypothetical protein
MRGFLIWFPIIIVVLYFGVAPATIINVPADFSTIQGGINGSNNGDTVLVQPGTYVENINFNGKSIVVIGDTLDNSITIIDGDSSGLVVSIMNGEDSTTVLAGFTIQNGMADWGGGISCENSSPTISNNTISENTTSAGGGILCLSFSSPTISNNIISRNTSDVLGGAGILCFQGSSPTISNNIISGNSSIGSSNDGGGIYCYEQSFPIISNNIITGNSAIGNLGNSGLGGGIYCETSSPVVFNNIIWANIAGYGLGNDVAVGTLTTPIFYYCDIQDTIEVSASFGTGVISEDPHFRDAENGDFHLMSTACGDSVDSPCIDVGDPYILDSLLDCSWGLGGLRSDMGAYGGGDSTLQAIDDYQSPLPTRPSLLQNYPDPFNSSTTIEYGLPEAGWVEIEVYDLLGRKVKTLVDEEKQAGQYQVVWDASNYSSGVYFYRIEAGEFTETRKMILLK